MSDHHALLGIDSSGQIVGHLLEFDPSSSASEPPQITITSVGTLAQLELDPDLTKVGMAVEAGGPHLAIWSHTWLYLYAWSPPRLDRLTRLRSISESESVHDQILAVDFVSGSLLSVLTKKTLKLYRLQETLSNQGTLRSSLKLSHQVPPLSNTTSFYEFALPTPGRDSDAIPDFTIVFLDRPSGSRSIKRVMPLPVVSPDGHSDPSSEVVIYEPTARLSKRIITSLSWLNAHRDAVLIGDSMGQLSTQVLSTSPETMSANSIVHPDSLTGAVTAIHIADDFSVVAGSAAGDVGIWLPSEDGPGLGALAGWTIITPVSIQSLDSVPRTPGRFVARALDDSVIIFEQSPVQIEVVARLQPRFGSLDGLWVGTDSDTFLARYRFCRRTGTTFQSFKATSQRPGQVKVPSPKELDTDPDSAEREKLDWIPIPLAGHGSVESPLPACPGILRIEMRELSAMGTNASALALARMTIASLMPWGISADLDTVIETGLNVRRSMSGRGLLTMDDAELGVAQTRQLLSLVVSLRVFLDDPSTERAAGEAVSQVSNLVGGADLATLATYWLDESDEVRGSARLLFGARLCRMSDQAIEALVERWQGLLPIHRGPDVTVKPSVPRPKGHFFKTKHDHQAVLEPWERDEWGPKVPKMVHRQAMLLIGLVVTERYKLMSTRTLKELSISVFDSLHTDEDPSVAIELCGRAFEILQNYIDAIDLLRRLFGLATGNVTELRSMAKHAALHVEAVNTPLFMTTLSYDIMASQEPASRIATMKLVIFMVRKVRFFCLCYALDGSLRIFALSFLLMGVNVFVRLWE